MGTTIFRTWCERSFQIYAPTGIGNTRPLLIALHPGLSSANKFQTLEDNFYTVMDEVADALNIYVAYPNGEDRVLGFNTWNASDNADFYACHIKAKCNLFLYKLIQLMVDEYSCDATEVYLLGYSNGAFMTYRYIAERPSDIAGALVFAGSLLKDYDECTQNIPITITHVHGVNDVTVPPLGGQSVLATYHIYKPLDDLEAFMISKGATFNRINLPTGEHSFPSIKAKLVTEANTDIYQLTENMLDPATVLEDFEELTGTGGLPQNGPASYTWSYFGGATTVTTNTDKRTQGSQAAVIVGSLTSGIQATGVNLIGYTSIRLDVWCSSSGESRLKVIDNAANEVSMDTLASTTDAYERHVLFVNLGTLVDLSSCTIQISGVGNPVVDCLRAV